MAIPVTSAQPRANASLWLKPRWRCFLRWRGMGTTVQWAGRIPKGVHSLAMARPSWTPTSLRTPYFRLCTSRDSSRSGPFLSQAQP